MKKAGPYHKYFFTADDDEYIRKNYQTLTNKEMADSLGVGLTSLRNRMYGELKIRRYVKWEVWTQQQEEYVINNFKVASDAEMAAEINLNMSRSDGRIVTRDMIQKKRDLLGLKRTTEEVTALYKTPFLQAKMYTIDKNSASINQHDNWIATVIAGRNNPDLRKELMENPEKYKELIDIKRLQLKLSKSLKQSQNEHSSNSNF